MDGCIVMFRKDARVLDLKFYCNGKSGERDRIRHPLGVFIDVGIQFSIFDNNRKKEEGLQVHIFWVLLLYVCDWKLKVREAMPDSGVQRFLRLGI